MLKRLASRYTNEEINKIFRNKLSLKLPTVPRESSLTMKNRTPYHCDNKKMYTDTIGSMRNTYRGQPTKKPTLKHFQIG